MSSQKSVIIKKVKKKGKEVHHGGSWKVAYADFVTAMMAFFLLLWLLTMSSDEKRVRLSQYFKHFSIHTEGGTSFMGKTSEIFADSGESKQKVFSSRHGEKVSSVEGITANRKILNDINERIEEALKKAVMEKLADVRDQIMVDVIEGGVRIQLTDKAGSAMFELGSNKLTPKAKKVFRIIGEQINPLPNKIIVEGHTDALPYAGREFSNWELSTARALSARKELGINGLQPERVIRVSGLASTDPLIKDDPADPRNRRISIVLKFPEEKEDIDALKKAVSWEDTDDSSGDRGLTLPDMNQNGPTPVKADINRMLNKEYRAPEKIVKKEKTAVDKKRGPVINEDSGKPVITENINPLSDQDTPYPVIDDEWSPISNMSRSIPQKHEKKNEISIKKEIKPERAVTEPLNASRNKPSVTTEERLNPVMEQKQWVPVIKKDKWDPVFGND